jgi:hypothetical protein
MRSESPNLINDQREQGRWRPIAMSPDEIYQALFPQFFSCKVGRFGQAVGVEYEYVAGVELVFSYRAMPFLKQS